MWSDVLKRPFITAGFIAFVLFIPLAATSGNCMVKRLGGKRWQALHRTIYIIAPLAIAHFWWMKAGKNDIAEPIVFGFIVADMLVMRLYWRTMQRRNQRMQALARRLAARCFTP
jgi:methionine sulfoxide reductase heme-binding subunit